MPSAKLLVPLLTAAAVAVLVGAFTALSSAQTRSKPVVKTMVIGGRTILVNRRSMTLYHLSVERRGHFICKNASCLAVWKPLLVPRGTRPSGAKSLGTVKRPDRGNQVTYRGGPLYTFVQDTKPGDTKGDGFKDVGVWHPVVLAGKASNPPPPPAPPPYGGGGY
jgi:predicted lipoprotein with Yx(FWY)xxD motif